MTETHKLNFKMIILALLITMPFLIGNFNNAEIMKEDLIDNTEEMPKNAGYWNLTESPIFIDDADTLYNWNKMALENDWCTGSGTWGDPYIIENVTIDSKGTGNCIEIRNSDVPFIIRNCTLVDTSEDPTDTGIRLWNTDNGKITNNTLSFNYYGIFISVGEFNNCTGNTIIGGRNGIRLEWSQNNNIIANTINDANSGVFLFYENYDNNIVGNLFYNCGFLFYPLGNYLNNIDTSNLANGKPIYYYTDKSNLKPNNFTNAGQIILFNCNHSIISNLNVSHCSVGISLFFCNNISITYVNSSYNSASGFDLRECNNITLSHNNLFHHEWYGISIDRGKFHNLTENTMKNCGIGIGFSTLEEGLSYKIDTSNQVNGKPVYFYTNQIGLSPVNFSNTGQIILSNVNNSIISDLQFSFCSTPITLGFCNNITISNVNTSYCNFGIYAFKSNHNIITGNNHMNHTGDGILLGDSNYNTISKSNISGNRRNGIFASYWCDYTVISGNTLTNNFLEGIYITGDHNLISGNSILNSGNNGLESNGAYTKISGNRISNNGENGLETGGSMKSEILGNNITYNNENGMKLGIVDSTISGNRISNNGENGIYLMGGGRENNTFTNNIIHYNGKIGLELSENTNINNIFNNEFIGNLIHAGDNGTINNWDNGSIGNSWDDYIGVDLNDDGIGDSPYLIDGSAGSIDNFPIFDDGPDDFSPPIITINDPVNGELFGASPPDYDIDITENNLDSVWYTMDGGVNNITITEYTGSVDESIWNTLPDGQVTIIFYANDNAGNIGTNNVIINKNTTTQPSIPGPNSILIMLVLVLGILGLVWRSKHRLK